jgi:hypothetical protein
LHKQISFMAWKLIFNENYEALIWRRWRLELGGIEREIERAVSSSPLRSLFNFVTSWLYWNQFCLSVEYKDSLEEVWCWSEVSTILGILSIVVPCLHASFDMMSVVSILAFHAGYLGSSPSIGTLFTLHCILSPHNKQDEAQKYRGDIARYPDTRAKAIYIYTPNDLTIIDNHQHLISLVAMHSAYI